MSQGKDQEKKTNINKVPLSPEELLDLDVSTDNVYEDIGDDEPSSADESNNPNDPQQQEAQLREKKQQELEKRVQALENAQDEAQRAKLLADEQARRTEEVAANQSVLLFSFNKQEFGTLAQLSIQMQTFVNNSDKKHHLDPILQLAGLKTSLTGLYRAMNPDDKPGDAVFAADSEQKNEKLPQLAERLDSVLDAVDQVHVALETTLQNCFLPAMQEHLQNFGKRLAEMENRLIIDRNVTRFAIEEKEGKTRKEQPYGFVTDKFTIHEVSEELAPENAMTFTSQNVMAIKQTVTNMMNDAGTLIPELAPKLTEIGQSATGNLELLSAGLDKTPTNAHGLACRRHQLAAIGKAVSLTEALTRIEKNPSPRGAEAIEVIRKGMKQLTEQLKDAANDINAINQQIEPDKPQVALSSADADRLAQSSLTIWQRVQQKCARITATDTEKNALGDRLLGENDTLQSKPDGLNPSQIELGKRMLDARLNLAEAIESNAAAIQQADKFGVYPPKVEAALAEFAVTCAQFDSYTKPEISQQLDADHPMWKTLTDKETQKANVESFKNSPLMNAFLKEMVKKSPADIMAMNGAAAMTAMATAEANAKNAAVQPSSQKPGKAAENKQPSAGNKGGMAKGK